ncbi:hypothetical protein L9W92_16995 [Pelotomaculum terephthalicicum JT]|nr:hypothetical protein [Pelotomaculum terephthalicicum]MCG9969701.1 hypothetical protein [Pelotomaculum terephthalicicum JT]
MVGYLDYEVYCEENGDYELNSIGCIHRLTSVPGLLVNMWYFISKKY